MRIRRPFQSMNELRNSVSPPRVIVETPAMGPPVVRPEVYRETTFPGTNLDKELKVVGDPYRNDIAYNLFMFHITGASVGAALGLNTRRQFLMIQNQSEDQDLYVNFGTSAESGIGLRVAFGDEFRFATGCPNNSVYLFFEGSTPQPVMLIEGSPIHAIDE